MPRTIDTDTDWLTRLGNWTCIPTEWIQRLIFIQLFYKVDDRWRLGRIGFLTSDDDDAMYRNGVIFVRLMVLRLPHFLWLQPLLGLLNFGLVALVAAIVNWFFGIHLEAPNWILLWPFSCGLFMLRWAGKDPEAREYFQCSQLGWKMNGRLGLVYRFLSDESAAAGTKARNYRQAVGWEDGGK